MHSVTVVLIAAMPVLICCIPNGREHVQFMLTKQFRPIQDALQELQAEERRAEERAARETAKRGPARQLATALISLRNWQIGKPQLSIGRFASL